MASPRTIYFPDSDNRIIVNALHDGRYTAIDPGHDDIDGVIWGLGDTELEAIADLAQRIREAE